MTKQLIDATIVANKAFASGMYSLTLDVPELVCTIAPGQFVELGLGFPDLVLRRPLSVFRCGDDVGYGHIEILYQVLGEGTRRLSCLSTGEMLSVLGPLGNSWPVEEGVRRALVIGGGIGVAPLALLVRKLHESSAAVTMIQSAQSAERLVAAEYFFPLCKRQVIATDDGTEGYHGLVTEPLADVLQEESFEVAYICGPEPMQEACAALCGKAGVRTWVSLERLMACGLGACLSCVVPTVTGLRRVCADGPIFPAEEVLWDEARASRVH
jgi:dihydroorotate dehydrogenase electron transfer subunit